MKPLDTLAEGDNTTQWTLLQNEEQTEGTSITNINHVNSTGDGDHSDTDMDIKMHSCSQEIDKMAYLKELFSKKFKAV